MTDGTVKLPTFKCLRCGALMGKCECWTKVKLRCPKCSRTMEVTRDPTDPPGTAVVESPCNRCEESGGRPETLYFDAQGRQFDGEKFAAT